MYATIDNTGYDALFTVLCYAVLLMQYPLPKHLQICTSGIYHVDGLLNNFTFCLDSMFAWGLSHRWAGIFLCLSVRVNCATLLYMLNLLVGP